MFSHEKIKKLVQVVKEVCTYASGLHLFFLCVNLMQCMLFYETWLTIIGDVPRF